MTKTCLIGHTGFVGSNILKQRQFDDCYNSKNIEEIAGKSYQEIVCAGVPGTKWIANQRPVEDKATIDRLLGNLRKVNAESVVLISTIDVYQDPASCFDEECSPVELPHYSYGVHRREVEQEFIRLFKNLLIVRLPALFGQDLKKNPAYDLMHAHYLENMNAQSAYQWYYLEHLSKDLELCQKRGLKLVNLFTEPLQTKELIQRFFADRYQIGDKGEVYLRGSNPSSFPLPKIVRYDLRSKYAEVFGGGSLYVRSKEKVLEDFQNFFLY